MPPGGVTCSGRGIGTAPSVALRSAGGRPPPGSGGRRDTVGWTGAFGSNSWPGPSCGGTPLLGVGGVGTDGSTAFGPNGLVRSESRVNGKPVFGSILGRGGLAVMG